jgi:hypothetical protein
MGSLAGGSLDGAVGLYFGIERGVGMVVRWG